ncbi:MAG: hypothetical protein WC655_27620, partial [Candidatus Hydrogenedentales bacterium]
MNQDIHPSSATSIPSTASLSGGPVFDFKRFIGLRWRMMAMVAVCLSIPTVVAAWFLTPVGYTASADIRLLSMEPFVLKPETDNTPYNTYVNTQIAMIKGNAVLSKVLELPSVRDLPLLTGQDDPLTYLQRRVGAQVSRGGEIMTLTCSMPEKDSARIVLEEIVSVYLKYTLGETASINDERLAWLTQERDARQMELDAQLGKIATLERSAGIPMFGETPLETGEPQLYNESLARAEEDLVKAQNAQVEAQNQIALVKSLIENVSTSTPIYEFEVEDRVSADARVGALRGEVVMMEARLAGAADMEKENLPTRKIEEKRLASLRENLAGVELRVRKEVLQSTITQQTRQIETLNKAVEEAQQRVDKYKQLAEGYKGRVEKTTEQLAQLKDLQDKAAETRAMLEQVRSNIAGIKVESNAPTRIQLIAPASVPGGGPDYTPRFMTMAMALTMSVGFAGALGVWRELMDQQVRTSQDLGRLTDLPVIAIIPHAEVDSIPDSVDMALITERLPLSTLADAYRRVLAQLLHPDMAQGGAKSLLVVSPTRGDGKSSLTSNLGVALAHAGRRVLLVDLSYRRPKLEKSFDIPHGEGLAEILNK